jgi:DNA adenine methylase
MSSEHEAGLSRAGRPAFPYVGGKRLLSRTIVSAIAEIPHDLYAEAFVGAGGVFLRREQVAPVEVVNDLSRDVTNFFRILQRHYQAFLDTLK